MKLATRGLSVLAAVAALAIGGAMATASAAPATTSKTTVAKSTADPSAATKSTATKVTTKRSCGAAKAGHMTCFSIRRTDVREPGAFKLQAVVPNVTPSGLSPANLDSAYKLSASAGSGQTVAIVDAYNDPNAASDLAVYRSQFGLPACTVANGCFRQVSQNGATSRCRPATPDGPARNPSTSTWSRPSARSATSCWSKRTRPPTPIYTPPRTQPSPSAPSSSRTAGAAANRRARPLTTPTSTTTGVAITASTGDDGHRRRVPGHQPVRHRGRRHPSDDLDERSRLDRVGLVRRRLRLLVLRREADLADRHHQLLQARRGGRFRSGRSRHRRRGLPDLRRVGLDRLRRHQRGGPDHRRRLRPRRHAGRVVTTPASYPVRAPVQPVRRDQRQQRHLWRADLHRRRRLGRPDRPRHPERHGRVHGRQRLADREQPGQPDGHSRHGGQPVAVGQRRHGPVHLVGDRPAGRPGDLDRAASSRVRRPLSPLTAWSRQCTTRRRTRRPRRSRSTVSAASACTPAQLLGNPGFETGSAAPWTSTAGVINPNGAGETVALRHVLRVAGRVWHHPHRHVEPIGDDPGRVHELDAVATTCTSTRPKRPRRPSSTS